MLQLNRLSRLIIYTKKLQRQTLPSIFISNAQHPSDISYHLNSDRNVLSLPLYRNFHLGRTLCKYKKSKQDLESDDEDVNDPEFKDERDSKVVKTKVNSLRADLLLKAGLGMARNKVEGVFYDSKIRVNGEKLVKKSVQLSVGDEIDVIRGFSQSNPSHLVVARVIILAANERDEGLGVSLRRYKSLLIENYPGINAYKSSETVEH